MINKKVRAELLKAISTSQFMEIYEKNSIKNIEEIGRDTWNYFRSLQREEVERERIKKQKEKVYASEEDRHIDELIDFSINGT